MTLTASSTTVDPLGAFVAGAFIGPARCRWLPPRSTSFSTSVSRS